MAKKVFQSIIHGVRDFIVKFWIVIVPVSLSLVAIFHPIEQIQWLFAGLLVGYWIGFMMFHDL